MKTVLDFENETGFDPGFDIEKTAESVIKTVLEGESFPCGAIVCLLITDPETVKEINSEYRDIDNTTDVLSFPNTEWDEPSDYECEGFKDKSLIDPESGLFMLGQIVLNEERIVSQANEYGHSVMREYSFLIAHSMLHLLGYDHMEEDEARIMEDKQREYLDLLGITR
ncbi:MAG: rRNA maturation RNase YbeY [Lachnospiraceae bacterium]|nr:rRNA maturation RNase YbeY [Lachnospiraceae bacterium]